MCDGGIKFFPCHADPESLQAGSGSLVQCDVRVPQIVALFGPNFTNCDQVLIDAMDNLNGL